MFLYKCVIVFWLFSRLFFFIFGFQQFDYDVVRCSFLWFCLVWRSLTFLNLWIYVFHQIWDVSSHSFFTYIFCTHLLFLPFCHSIGNKLDHLILSYTFCEDLLSVLKPLFFLSVLSFIKFFTSDIVFFSSKIFIFFIGFYFSADNLHFSVYFKNAHLYFIVHSG